MLLAFAMFQVSYPANRPAPIYLELQGQSRQAEPTAQENPVLADRQHVVPSPMRRAADAKLFLYEVPGAAWCKQMGKALRALESLLTRKASRFRPGQVIEVHRCRGRNLGVPKT